MYLPTRSQWWIFHSSFFFLFFLFSFLFFFFHHRRFIERINRSLKRHLIPYKITRESRAGLKIGGGQKRSLYYRDANATPPLKVIDRSIRD